MLHPTVLANTVAAWQSFLTVGGFAAVIGGFVALQLWSQRRRRRGEEASAYDGKGADVIGTGYQSIL